MTGIEGVGEKTSEKLLTHFGSVTKIKAATKEELELVVGKAATKQVIKYFIKNKEVEDKKE